MNIKAVLLATIVTGRPGIVRDQNSGGAVNDALGMLANPGAYTVKRS